MKAGLDAGGDFYTCKKRVLVSHNQQTITCKVDSPGQLSESLSVYKGDIWPGGLPVPVPWPPDHASAKAELDKWGTKAIAQCSPVNPVSNLLTALLELYHDKLPHLLGQVIWRQKTLSARNAGEEYLNYQFGYKPMAADIASFANGVVEFDRLCKQYIRDAGRVVRRRFTFPPLVEESTTKIASSKLSLTTPAFSEIVDLTDTARGDTYRYSRVSTRRWFSGAFEYFLPPDFYRLSDFDKHVFLAEKLLGIQLTPDVVWNVAPWSWAVDWFTTAGNVVHNVSQMLADSLVVRYGYVMEHVIASDTYYQLPPTGFYARQGAAAPLSVVVETKQRRKAYPFGFGTLLTELTDRQKAIIAAIGSTRR
jgi:hypothetical protein